ncbi:hypothetical protein [Jannaschia sp. W003]|uniref:hypothetical protein n=1 Tax=Jannaschia sp. W003 TaxID=2867012 RepID=UPI0021A86997|nr:hypothetical protein [Jannaschia sp. W003]UWQ21596.1 hypothetical protein K3554_00750 [Jannaschia sp. W003]
MDVLYSGFDGLDLALRFNIGDDFAAYLDAKQKEAAEARHDIGGMWADQWFTVASSGGQGGYAFRLDTGPTGETWFLKRPHASDPWGVRVSAKSAALLAHGLGGWQRRMEAVARAFGASMEPGTTSIGRVDVAVDILAPDFVLDDDAFVMHARTNRKAIKEIVQTNGRSGRLTSVTVGKMPGRQVILYDKREEVTVKRKVEWHLAWNARRTALGLPPLDLADPAASRVWRVEVRAAKQHLKKQWHVTGWGDLHAMLSPIIGDAMDRVRYCAPSSDTNRARWPTHKLWTLARNTLLDHIVDQPPCLDPETIREETKAQKIELLMKQSLGCLTGVAALERVSAVGYDRFLDIIGKRLATASRHHPDAPDVRLRQAGERYARLTGRDEVG